MRRFCIFITASGLLSVLALWFGGGPRNERGAVAIVPVAHGDEKCSNHSLKGRYGISISGTSTAAAFVIGPGSGVGVFTADGKGTFTGTVSGNVAGVSVNGPVTGTYAVLDDCTGTGTLTYPNWGLTLNGSFVIVDDNHKLFLAYNTPSQGAPLGVANAVAEKQ